MKTRQGVLPDTLLKHGFLKYSEVADKESLAKKPCNKCEKRPSRKLNLQESDLCLHVHLLLMEARKQSLMDIGRQKRQICTSISQIKKCVP